MIRSWFFPLSTICCVSLLAGCYGPGAGGGINSAAGRAQARPPVGSSQNYPEGTVIEPDDPQIRYIGHWDEVGIDQQAVTVNSGSRILCAFTGHELSGRFGVHRITNPAQIYVSIDGHSPALYKLDSRIENFSPKPLAGDRHTVQITVKDVDERADRWVPPLASAVVFKGFILAPHCHVLPLPPVTGPKMEFYGDSITQGVRALSMALGPNGSDGTSDYAYLTATAFGAISNQIGFGRQGIIRTGNGEVPPAPQSFGWNFKGSKADPSFIPQVVVINQGTNDVIYPSSRFVPAYRAYVAEIRKAYPRAWIFCMRPFGGFHAEDVRRAVEVLHDSRIVYVDTTGWLARSDFTDGIHPTVHGHLIAARKLVRVISSRTGLKPIHSVGEPWWCISVEGEKAP